MPKFDPLIAALKALPLRASSASNTVTEHRAEVTRALESFLGPDSGRPTPSFSVGVVEAVVRELEADWPDFRTVGELNSRIKALAHAIKATRVARNSLQRMKLAHEQTFRQIGQEQHAYMPKQLSYGSISILNGVSESTLEALDIFVSGAEYKYDMLTMMRSRYYAGQGKPADPRAYFLTEKVARAYLALHGELPTHGNDTSTRRPSTACGRMLEELFQTLGVKHKTPSDVLAAVKAAVTEAEITQTRRKLSGFVGLLSQADFSVT